MERVTDFSSVSVVVIVTKHLYSPASLNSMFEICEFSVN